MTRELMVSWELSGSLDSSERWGLLRLPLDRRLRVGSRGDSGHWFGRRGPCVTIGRVWSSSEEQGTHRVSAHCPAALPGAQGPVRPCSSPGPAGGLLHLPLQRDLEPLGVSCCFCAKQPLRGTQASSPGPSPSSSAHRPCQVSLSKCVGMCEMVLNWGLSQVGFRSGRAGNCSQTPTPPGSRGAPTWRLLSRPGLTEPRTRDGLQAPLAEALSAVLSPASSWVSRLHARSQRRPRGRDAGATSWPEPSSHGVRTFDY